MNRSRIPASPSRGPQRTELLGRRAECAALDQLLIDASKGRSRVVVLRGEPGIGKTALLGHVAEERDGWHVARAVGVESEVEFPYSGLHQICSTMVDGLERLPDPQRAALETVFGLSSGPPPNQFVVALATLTLAADRADQQPVLCLVDDAHWIDSASIQVLTFVARRLVAERIALVFAARIGDGDHVLSGLPEISVGGLGDSDSESLLLTHLPGPVDSSVRQQIITESHGNPLALLELGRTASVATLAGGFGLTVSGGVTGTIARTVRGRLGLLPAETRLLLLAAAAEPLGDPILLRRAGEHLGIQEGALSPAVEAELIKVDFRVEFAHPMVRSVVYDQASVDDRRLVHAALAQATDREGEPDRRAWHSAYATSGLDEEVASELTRSAARAQARGGMGAAAAFMRRAVELTADPAPRAQRALAAAELSLQAGAIDAALDAVGAARSGQLDPLGRAQADLLSGQLALISSYGKDAVPLLLRAARELEPIDLALARRAYLTAWGAAVTAGHLGEPAHLSEICNAVRALPPLPPDPHPLEMLLDGIALVVTDGRAAATPVLQRASAAVATMPAEDVLRWGWFSNSGNATTWNFDQYGEIFKRQAQLVRDAGALSELLQHLSGLAWYEAFAGNFEEARLIIVELDSVSAAIGSPLPPLAALRLLSLQGRASETEPLIALTVDQAASAGQGIAVVTANWAAAVLYNGLARYDEAALAADQVVTRALDPFTPNFALPELIEAAARRGDTEAANQAFDRLVEATEPATTDWAAGMEARCRALVTDGGSAEESHREALERFGRTKIRTELARAHLLYGEWLRREGRRVDARTELRTAHEMLSSIGMEAFAERARRELAASGETAHARDASSRLELTAQEEQVARLAGDGSANREIAERLYLSTRTVEWHLGKIYAKLGIRSRSELRTMQLGDPALSS
jgi:DNA-binding CsgD family transcriptional regulator